LKSPYFADELCKSQEGKENTSSDGEGQLMHPTFFVSGVLLEFNLDTMIVTETINSVWAARRYMLMDSNGYHEQWWC
jgi:hypothetical protein